MQPPSPTQDLTCTFIITQMEYQLHTHLNDDNVVELSNNIEHSLPMGHNLTIFSNKATILAGK